MVTPITTLLEIGNDFWNQTYNVDNGEEILIKNIATSIRLMIGSVNPTGKEIS